MCLISISIISATANASELTPAPDLLELLGQTLAMEQFGVDVNQLIDQRLEAQKKNKPVLEKIEESNS